MGFDSSTTPPTIGDTVELFRGRFFYGNSGGGLSYDIAPEGDRFLMLQMPAAGPPWVNVVLDLFGLLNDRVTGER